MCGVCLSKSQQQQNNAREKEHFNVLCGNISFCICWQNMTHSNTGTDT